PGRDPAGRCRSRRPAGRAVPAVPCSGRGPAYDPDRGPRRGRTLSRRRRPWGVLPGVSVGSEGSSYHRPAIRWGPSDPPYPGFCWILAVRDETTDELDRLADGPIHQRPAGAPLSDRARSDRRGDRPADLLGRRGAGHVPRSRPSLADVFDRANDRVVGVLV